MRNQRFAYVDLIRGLCALSVLVLHYRWFFARSVHDWRADAPPPFFETLWPIYDYGGVAVQMFWILSGFVFAVAYGHHGKSIDQRTFWVHRFARLYPLHFASLCLVAALQAASLRINGSWLVEGNNDLPHFFLQLFLASNWFTLEGSYNSPIWSVSAEVLVYLTFILFMKRVGLSLRWALALSFIGLALRIATANPVSLCMALFFAGVAIAIVAPRLQQLLGRGLIPFAVALLACSAGVGFVVNVAGYPGLVRQVAIHLGTPAVLLLFIAMDYNFRRMPRGFDWIGEITYSVYLLHIPILIALRLAFDPIIAPILPTPAGLIAFVMLVVATSRAAYRWLELPAQRYFRRTLSRRPGCVDTDVKPESSRAPASAGVTTPVEARA